MTPPARRAYTTGQHMRRGGTIYYRYDGCGNTTAKQEASGTTYYQWDHENLMTRIDLPDGSHSYFAYDADSKRVEKRDSDGYTRFIYQGPDMLRLLLERDGDGETKVHYTMGSGLEAMRRADGGGISSGDSSFYHYDWLGSTFGLTDADETVTDTYRYNAWGEVLDRTGSTENPHTYVGNQRYYAATDAALMMLGVRYYAMALARFISVDPLAIALYAYAGNMAASALDPEGLKWQVGMRPPPYHREDPSSWWNTRPVPPWVRVVMKRQVRNYVEFGRIWPGPETHRMLRHWASNTGTTYWIDMEAFMMVSSDERATYLEEITDAVRFIEAKDLRPTPVTPIVSDHKERNAGRLLSESTDWWYAVGGHLGHGYALVRRRGDCFEMQFVWRLEDTFTAREKIPEMAIFEFAGIARGFWVNGEVLRTYEWPRGAFRQRYPDPLNQGGKNRWPIFG